MSDQAHKILIVDDDQDILNFLKTELSSLSFELHFALTEEDAMRLLSTVNFSLAIIDIFLSSKETSSELIHFLTSKKESPNYLLPTVIISAKIDSEYAKKIRLKGSNIIATILKPFHRGQILDFIKSVASKKALIANTDSEKRQKIQIELEKKGYNCLTTTKSNHVKNLVDLFPFDLAFISEEIFEKDLEPFLMDLSEKSSFPVILTESQTELTGPNVFAQLKKDEDIKSYLSEVDKLSLWQNFTLDPNKDLYHDLTEVSQENTSDQNGKLSSLSKEYGLNQLMISAIQGNFEQVKKLIIDDPSLVLRKSKAGKTALHYCAQNKNLEIARVLIDCGAKVNERDENQHEPLYDAVVAKNYPLVEFLIENGARITSRFDGKSYLSLAVLVDSLELVELFLKVGLDPELKDYQGLSPIDLAKRKKTSKIHNLLISRK